MGYSLYPAQLAVAEAIKRRLDKSKVGIIVAECGSGKSVIEIEPQNTIYKITFSKDKASIVS